MDTSSAFEINVGAIFFGYSVACVFYGCSTIQTFIYFRVCSRDALWVKISIFAIWLLESMHTALLATCVYIVVVKDADQVMQEMETVKWALADAIYLTSAIELGVRVLFISRIWKLSKGNRLVTALLCLLSASVCGTSLLWGAQAHNIEIMLGIRGRVIVYIYTTFGLALFTDVLMTGGQCVLLWQNRTGFTATDSIVRRLVLYILNTGMLVCVVTGATLITYARSNSLIFIAVYLALPKVFFNSLLASLNIRQLIFADFDPAPREGVRAPAPGAAGAGKADLASSLAVHVETTTVHRIDDGLALASRAGRRWRSEREKAMWLPMQGSPECSEEADCADGGREDSRSSSKIWDTEPNLDMEARQC